MSITVEHWRVVIGQFSGGRSGTSTSPRVRSQSKQKGSTGCMVTALLLTALLFSPVLLDGWSSLHGSTTYNSSRFQYYCKVSQTQGNSCVTVFSPVISELIIFNDSSNTDNAALQPRVSRKKLNQQVKALTGNRSNRGIKLAHWNAGSAHLHNKMDELETVVSDLHPHVLGVSEANFKREHSLEDVQIPEYDIVLSKTIENDQLRVSRVVCYKHQSMVGKVRDDLMDENFSSIWLELGLPRKKKFLVC